MKEDFPVDTPKVEIDPKNGFKVSFEEAKDLKEPKSIPLAKPQDSKQRIEIK